MVARSGWVPDRGDLIWLTFDPQAGREQAGRRPALVLSSAGYNIKSSLAVVCPVTSHVKGYPFEVAVSTERLKGCVLADHLKSVDWKQRRAKLIGRAAPNVIAEVINRVAALFGV